MKNGTRFYKLELAPGSNIGSYHVLDGQRVTIKYAGQRQTCARCLQAPENCKGRGIARKCETEGGIKMDFGSYILDLWRTIGYSPEHSSSNITPDVLDIEEQVGGYFTPQKCTSSPEKFKGINVKNILKDTDLGEIVEFLIELGLPIEKRDLI